MRSFGISFTCIVATGVFACSGGGNGTSQPGSDGGAADGGADAAPGSDSGGVDASGNPDGGSDTGAPVTLLSATPSDGTFHVSVLSKVVLTFSGSLKAASVTQSSVQLFASATTLPLQATVTYDDATHSITLTPATAMSANSSYRVASSALAGQDGTPVANAALSFTTTYDAEIDELAYNATGTTIILRTVCTQTSDGRIDTYANMAAGPDGVFNTADDVPTRYMRSTYGTTSNKTTYYNAAGPDGLWFTADDVISQYNLYDITQPPRPRSTYYTGKGADGVWFTADDVVGTFGQVQYDASGHEVSAVYYSGPGPDGIPYTSDDVLNYRFADNWTAMSNTRVDYTGAGPDAVWFTADDVIGSVDVYAYDTLGHQTTITFKGKGADGIWMTSDDTTTQLWTSTWDTKGIETRFVVYSGAGADAMWGTMDDVVSTYFGFTADPNGALTTRTTYEAGPDGLWFTSDDVAEDVTRLNPMK